ncbi:MAG: YceK/YidQ family lipoprotein [Armatimonadota bacterium]
MFLEWMKSGSRYRRLVRGLLTFHLLGVVIVCGTGCATVKARSDYIYKRHPYVYPASRMDLGHPRFPIELGGMGHGGGKSLLMDDISLTRLLGGLLGLVLGVVVDLPVSIVTDTVMLPYDLRGVSCWNYCSNTLHNAAFAPSSGEFESRYREDFELSLWSLGNKDQSSRTILRDRLFLLVNTRAAPHLAESSVLDKELAGTLMDWTTHNMNDPYSGRILAGLARNPRTPPDVLRSLVDKIADSDLASSPAMDDALARVLLDRVSLQTNVVLRATILKRLAENPAASSSILRTLVEHPTFGQTLWQSVVHNPCASDAVLHSIAARCKDLIDVHGSLGRWQDYARIMRIIESRLYQRASMISLAQNPRTRSDELYNLVQKTMNIEGVWESVIGNPNADKQVLAFIATECRMFMDVHGAQGRGEQYVRIEQMLDRCRQTQSGKK